MMTWECDKHLPWRKQNISNIFWDSDNKPSLRWQKKWLTADFIDSCHTMGTMPRLSFYLAAGGWCSALCRCGCCAKKSVQLSPGIASSTICLRAWKDNKRGDEKQTIHSITSSHWLTECGGRVHLCVHACVSACMCVCVCVHVYVCMS